MGVHPDAERAVDEARARFRRTLSVWALDVMELRRRGLDRPVMRRRPGEPRTAADVPLVNSGTPHREVPS